MTDFDFEQLMKKALENNDEPSELLNAKLKNKIKEYKPKKAGLYYLKTTAVAACMVIAVTSIILNSSPQIQSKMNTIPGVRNFANALSFKNNDTINPTVNVAKNDEKEITDAPVADEQRTISPQGTKNDDIKHRNNTKNKTVSNEKEKENSKNNSILIDDILNPLTIEENNQPYEQVAMAMERSLAEIPAFDGEDSKEQAENEYDWGIELNCENITPEGLTIVISQHGKNDLGELMAGELYELLINDNGAWEEVPPKIPDDQLIWNSIGYIINTDDDTKIDIDWQNLYGELLPGEYKIGKNITNVRQPGDYDECMYYAEFEIK